MYVYDWLYAKNTYHNGISNYIDAIIITTTNYYLLLVFSDECSSNMVLFY